MEQRLRIRPTTPADLAEIDALLARSYPALLKADYPPSALVTAIPIIARAQPRLLASGTYFAVCDGSGVIVGAGGWTPDAPGSVSARPALGHIRHVVTDHRQTRRGIGRLLLRRIVLDARASGMSELSCQSTLTAEPFYAACGFRRIRAITVPLHGGIDFPAVLMQRSTSDETE